MARESEIAKSNIDLDTSEFTSVKDDYDAEIFSRVKTQWFFGEWEKLAEFDLKSMKLHPERARIALLVASAHDQLGHSDETKKFARLALHWGCPPLLVSKILIAGVHNTLGKAYSIKRDDKQALKHFKHALRIATSNNTDLESISYTRSVRELSRLGLLPQAADILGNEIKNTYNNNQRPHLQNARLKVLETELELLRSELSLSLQRNQLYQRNLISKIEDKIQPDNSITSRVKQLSVSQLGQDIWVLEQTNYKKGGFFIEFGATDGVLISNTWLLESEFDWNGICAEPNPKYFKQLKRNRKCLVSAECIGSVTGESVEFLLADDYSGMQKHVYSDSNSERRSVYGDINDNNITLQTISLHDFLLKYDAPKYIDYISIDTEGSELEILEPFPFKEWSIKLFTIEHNYTNNRKSVRKIMEDNGYTCYEHEWDDWFISNNDKRTST